MPPDPTGARYDPALLREIAGERSYQRGVKYYAEGRVTRLRDEGDRVTGWVEGSDTYRVRLRGRGDNLRADCNCPAYDDTGFCKHIVAVALAANGEPGAAADADPAVEVETWLRGQSAETLAALLIEHAAEDDALRTRLDTLAARALHPAQAEAALRRALDDQTRARALPAYRACAPGLTASPRPSAPSRTSPCTTPPPRSASPSTPSPASRPRSARSTNSNGYGLWLLEQAAEAHQAAVAALRPDPTALAATLFRREMEDGYGAFTAPPTPTPRPSAPRAAPNTAASPSRRGTPCRPAARASPSPSASGCWRSSTTSPRPTATSRPGSPSAAGISATPTPTGASPSSASTTAAPPRP